MNLPFAHILRQLEVKAFLHWWGQGLAACLPVSLRQLFVSSPRCLIIQLQDGELILLQQQNDETQEVGRYPLQVLDDGRLREVVLTIKYEQIILRLPAAKVLTKEIPLPLAAEANLRQVVGFEIDRFTPFTLNQVYYDVQILERLPALRRMRVKMTVVTRGLVDSLLDRLEKIELSPNVVDVTGSELDINLLPVEKRPRGNQAMRRLQWGLALLGVGLLVSAGILPLWQQRSLVIDLTPQVEAAQKRAEEILTLRQKLDKTIEVSQFLITKRQQTPLFINLLDELTTLLPDSTWLEQLEVQGGEIQIRGQSSGASTLVGLLEASKSFKNPSFRSPITVDNRTGQDRFYLAAQIARGS